MAIDARRPVIAPILPSSAGWAETDVELSLLDQKTVCLCADLALAR
jgi:hypothetical protein